MTSDHLEVPRYGAVTLRVELNEPECKQPPVVVGRL